MCIIYERLWRDDGSVRYFSLAICSNHIVILSALPPLLLIVAQHTGKKVATSMMYCHRLIEHSTVPYVQLAECGRRNAVHCGASVVIDGGIWKQTG